VDEIQMEEIKAPTNEPDIPDQPAVDNRNPTRTLNVDPSLTSNVGQVKSENAEGEEMNEFFNTHFLVLAVKNYQKSSLWWCFVISLCAMRAATGFTVFLAYMSLICRIIQIVGIVLQSEKVSKASYLIATLLLVMIFFTEMVKESADIIHESVPTPETITDIQREVFAPNYRAPRNGKLL
jgi:hypothetical protein